MITNINKFDLQKLDKQQQKYMRPFCLPDFFQCTVECDVVRSRSSSGWPTESRVACQVGAVHPARRRISIGGKSVIIRSKQEVVVLSPANHS